MVHRYISLAYLTYFSFTSYIPICWQSVEEVDFALMSSNLLSRNGISVRQVLILKIADLRTSIPFDTIAIAIQTSSQAESANGDAMVVLITSTDPDSSMYSTRRSVEHWTHALTALG